MARTVNRNQTLEEFRSIHNDLAGDVGSITGLAGTISNGNNLVDAINELENKTFFFQTFEYVATASQTTFSGADANSNVMKLRSGRYQIFWNDVSAGTSKHMVEGTDYSLGAPQADGTYLAVVLTTGIAASDTLTVYAFTGSVVGDGGGAGGAAGQFTETAANTIYNINSNGVILNGDSTSRTTSLESGYTLQLAGKTFAEDDLISSVAGKKVQFPIVSDGTAQFTGGVATGFSSVTSAAFVGDITGNVTGNASGQAGTVATISGHAISGLSDVTTNSPQNGQVMVWNASSGYWENQDAAATYTDENAQDTIGNVSFVHSNHTNVSATYDDTSGEIRLTAAATYGDSDVQSYLSGGDGLAMSGSGVFSVNTSNGIEINSDNVELDYEIVSTAPSSASGTSTGHLWFVV